jgi:serine/threonine protein kinase
MEVFGRYQLDALLGRGGQGEVFRAFDTVKSRAVALKRLPPAYANDEHFKARFRRESQVAAALNEPHVIPIHDFGEIDGQLFIDMRLVEGEDLGALASRGLALNDAVEIIDQIAQALDAAHASGLVHRDVKPSNIIVTSLRFAYLLDFGIATTTDGPSLTAGFQTAVGTPAYMAPERVLGEPDDARGDVYSLACVLFECIAGCQLFDGAPMTMMYAHANTAPPLVSQLRADIPPAMDAVLSRGLAKRPEERYATAGELAAAAREALFGVAAPSFSITAPSVAVGQLDTTSIGTPMGSLGSADPASWTQTPSRRIDVQHQLAQLDLFRRLSEGDLRRLVERGLRMDVEAGQEVIAEGDDGFGFHLILSGTARVTKGGRLLRMLGPGDYFGEISLIDGGPVSAAAFAEEPLEMLVIRNRQFQPLIEGDGDFARTLLRVLCERIRSYEAPIPSQ